MKKLISSETSCSVKIHRQRVLLRHERVAVCVWLGADESLLHGVSMQILLSVGSMCHG